MMKMAKPLSGFAFVDVTDLCVSRQQTAEQMTLQMQQSVTNWEGLLKMMGGILVPKKCFWYLINQVWADGKWHYQTPSMTSATLQVQDSYGNLNTIPHLAVTKAR